MGFKVLNYFRQLTHRRREKEIKKKEKKKIIILICSNRIFAINRHIVCTIINRLFNTTQHFNKNVQKGPLESKQMRFSGIIFISLVIAPKLPVVGTRQKQRFEAVLMSSLYACLEHIIRKKRKESQFLHPQTST